MTRQIIKTPQVVRDLMDHFVFLGERNLPAADRFMQAAEATFHLLAAMPEMGALRRYGELTALRMFPVRDFPKYLVFYRSTEDGIEVVRVLHASRDLRPLLDPEQSEGGED